MRWGFRVLDRTALRPLWALWVTACAASEPTAAPALDPAFARIQLHEAEIAHAELALQAPDATCAGARTAAASAEGSAAALCGIARGVADADALARCARAERAVKSVSAQAALRCPEAAPSGTADPEAGTP
jgi:hypothetical protein